MKSCTHPLIFVRPIVHPVMHLVIIDRLTPACEVALLPVCVQLIDTSSSRLAVDSVLILWLAFFDCRPNDLELISRDVHGNGKDRDLMGWEWE